MTNTKNTKAGKLHTGAHSAESSAKRVGLGLGLGAQHGCTRASRAGGTGVLRKTTAAVCAAALASCLVPATVLAQGGGSNEGSDYGSALKTEVVYVKTDGTGEQTGVYVVNQFQSSTDTEVRDAGTYESVRNLSDEQELSAAGTSSFNVAGGETYLYQGNLSASTQMPWNIELSYTLDGRSVSAEELAGASGELEMTLAIEPNSTCQGNYADNYLLQVSASLDNELAWSIEAPDATVAQATGSTQLTYMVFPGKSASYTVRAQVADFEFSGWQLVGIPLSIALDIDDGEFGDATEDLDKLEDAGKELNSGAQELDSGAQELKSAVRRLQDGSLSLSEGLSTLAQGSSGLQEGAQQLQYGVGQQAEQLGTAAAQVDVAAAQAAYSQAAQAYTAAFAGAFTQAFNAAYQGYAAAGVPAQEAQQRAQADAAQAAGQATAAEYAALEEALTAFVTAQATKSGYESAASALSEVSASCEQLGAGLAEYAQAAGQLSAGAGEWSNGAAALYGGGKELASGAGKLAEGTQELEDETSGMSTKMIDEVRDKLESYLNPSFELRDFVNGSTDGMQSVQFVYMTEAVEIDDEDEDEPAPQDERSFLEKLLALFGL
ncbi:MAG: hypothetical protein ACI36W_00830 [Coriobacteriales bacterium]